MEDITPEQLKQLKIIPNGKKHPVRAKIEMMEIDDIIKIDKADLQWRGKTPSIFTNKIEKKRKKKFTVSKLADKSGWVVQRIK